MIFAAINIFGLSPIDIQAKLFFMEARKWQIAADYVSGPSNLATVATSSATGTIDWGPGATGKFYATGSDNAYATVTMAIYESSFYITATSFFAANSIPSNSVINGIRVEIERNASTAGGGTFIDGSVMLIKGGTIQGSDYAASTTYWPVADATNSYGGETDLWGLGWTANDIATESFGVAFSVFDSSTTAASSTASVDDVTVIVYHNAPPSVATPILYGGNAITLSASTTQAVYATTTITDTNSADEISTVTAVFYNSSSTEACSASENLCYTGAANTWLGVSCDWLGATTSATAIDASCTADFWFDAVPTDTGDWSTTLGYATTDWEVWFQGTDVANATGAATTSQELTTLSGVEVEEIGIDYGTVLSNATSTTGKSITINTTGNCPINVNVSGENMATSALSIAVEQQKYATSGDVGYEGLGWTASTGVQLLNLDSGKTEATSTPATDIVYWAILIPSAQTAGDYSGTNTIAAVEDTIDW